MAILDELFGPNMGALSRYTDVNDPEFIARMLEGLRAQAPGPEVRTTEDVNRIIQRGPEFQTTVRTEQPPAPPPQVLPPAHRPPPVTEETVNPMERLGAILMGLGDRGQGALARLGGALTAGPAFDRGRRDENATLRALMEADPTMTMDRARTIARQPQALTAFFGPRAGPTFGVIGTDAYGTQMYGWIDPRNRTVTPVDPRQPGTGDADRDGNRDGNRDLTGQAFLDSIPDTALRAQIQGIVDGRLPYPTGQYARSPQGRRLMALINQYDPTFDATVYNARAAARRDFASGAGARNVRSLNTVFGHLDTLNSAIDGLGNFSRLPAINVPWNTIRGQFSTDFQAAYSRFSTSRQAVASELMRVFREVGASTTEIQEWQRMMETAASPVALREGVRTATELIMSRLTAMADTYNRTMGTNRTALDLLSPEHRAIYERLSGHTTGTVDAPPRSGPPGPRQEGPPPGPQGPGNTPPPTVRPPVPSGVPADAEWSPSRRQWRHGTMLFNERGQRLGR